MVLLNCEKVGMEFSCFNEYPGIFPCGIRVFPSEESALRMVSLLLMRYEEGHFRG